MPSKGNTRKNGSIGLKTHEEKVEAAKMVLYRLEEKQKIQKEENAKVQAANGMILYYLKTIPCFDRVKDWFLIVIYAM